VKKGMQAIIESARVALTYCDGFEQTRSVLNGVWRTAFKRGHIKGMVDNETAVEKENDEVRIEQNHVYENGIREGVMRQGKEM
jgi:hypothetical protein